MIVDEPSFEATPTLPEDDVVPPSGDPSAEPTDEAGNGPAGMRVVDHGAAGGLLETIVGGVTGFYFGG